MGSESAEATFRELYRQWFRAISEVDHGYFDALLGADWVYTDYEGRVRDRDGYHERLRELVPGGVAMTLGGLHPRIYDGRFAVVTGAYRSEAAFLAGPDVSVVLAFTSAWMAGSDGQWRCVAHHTTIAPS